MMDLLFKGGPVMWPLLAGSIIGLAIMLERSFFLARRRLPSRDFAGRLIEQIRQKRLGEALVLAGSSRHPVAHIAHVYLANLACPETLRQDILRREGSRMLEKSENNLRVLSVIAHLAPMLGLLGTVTGLVVAFAAIEQLEGMARPGELAAGIWESLLTTVFGLVVALPCLAAYHLFEHKADRDARHMQFMVSELNELFGKAEVELGHAAAGDDALTMVQG